MKQAVSSPLLETTIEGATDVIINISGDITLMDANDAASYVEELVGEDANIIFGAMYDDVHTPMKQALPSLLQAFTQRRPRMPVWRHKK